MMTYDEIYALKPGDKLQDVSGPALELTVVKVDAPDKCILVKTSCGTLLRYGLFGCSRWPLYADVLKKIAP